MPKKVTASKTLSCNISQFHWYSISLLLTERIYSDTEHSLWSGIKCCLKPSDFSRNKVLLWKTSSYSHDLPIIKSDIRRSCRLLYLPAKLKENNFPVPGVSVSDIWCFMRCTFKWSSFANFWKHMTVHSKVNYSYQNLYLDEETSSSDKTYWWTIKVVGPTCTWCILLLYMINNMMAQ